MHVVGSSVLWYAVARWCSTNAQKHQRRDEGQSKRTQHEGKRVVVWLEVMKEEERNTKEGEVQPGEAQSAGCCREW